MNRLDQQVRTVLDVRAQRGFLEKTLVIFYRDNGAALPHGIGSLCDPGLNVPLLVRWPGVVKAGDESHTPLSGDDLAPTLLVAAGVPIPARMTDKSFLAAARRSIGATPTCLRRTRPPWQGAGPGGHVQQRLRPQPLRAQ